MRIEIGQHIQVGDQRIAAIHVVVILAAPEKGFLIGAHIYPIQMNPAAAQLFHLRLRKIIAHDGDLFDGLHEMTGCIRNIRGGTANDPIGLPKGSFDRVKSHGTNGDK